MLQPATLSFLTDLAENNNKTWFDANRNRYQDAKADFETLVSGILSVLAEKEPLFREHQAKDCIFRIFRDVRFSKDKTPYKAHFGAYFSTGGKKWPGAGYYVHVDPTGKSFAGGGLWNPEPPLLKAVRQEIDYHFAEFKSIIEEPLFLETFGQVEGEKVKSIPQGYEASNIAIEYLKMKSFTVHHSLPNATLTSKQLIAQVTELFKIMQPFIFLLNRGVSS